MFLIFNQKYCYASLLNKLHLFKKKKIYKNTRLIFAQNLRTIKNNSASAEEPGLKFSVKV